MGEAVQRHHNQHEKADDQQDTGHADEHTVKEVRPRYSCFYKIRHPGDCDGQSGYGVSKLDSIVEEVVRQIFAQFREVSRKKLLESVKTNDAARIQKKVKKIQKDLESKQKELDDLKAETILVIRGVSALDKELLGTLVAEAREALETLEKQLVQAQEEAGQERAVGALLYASGLSTDTDQQRVIHLIDAQERSLRVFAEFAEPALRSRWEQQQIAPGIATLERLRRTLCLARPGAALDSNLSDAWFSVGTERIDALWQLQVALVQQLRQDCEARILEAQQDLQDSKGLLQGLRNNPPHRTHAVDRFFDNAIPPEAAPAHTDVQGTAESAALLELLQTQSQRMASMEAELETARRALNERKVIERAKGVLMQRLGMNEEEAFRTLRKTSMDQNRRLLDVAEATLSLPDLAFAQSPNAGKKNGH